MPIFMDGIIARTGTDGRRNIICWSGDVLPRTNNTVQVGPNLSSPDGHQSLLYQFNTIRKIRIIAADDSRIAKTAFGTANPMRKMGNI